MSWNPLETRGCFRLESPMFFKVVSTFIVVIFSLTYPVWASELSDPVQLPTAPPEELQFIETRLADMPVDIPIFPGAEEVAANITNNNIIT